MKIENLQISRSHFSLAYNYFNECLVHQDGVGLGLVVG